jgi:hypothetical protein
MYRNYEKLWSINLDEGKFDRTSDWKEAGRAEQ